MASMRDVWNFSYRSKEIHLSSQLNQYDMFSTAIDSLLVMADSISILNDRQRAEVLELLEDLSDKQKTNSLKSLINKMKGE